MFGGMDETGSLNSDLWSVKPNYLENEELISTTGQYKRKVVPAVHLTVEVLNTQGRGPSARMQHAACYVHSTTPLLLIHGGRNDYNFKEFNDSALNDLHILDLVTLEWQRLAIYGSVPDSRWGH
jgi:hypothetical protein